MSKIKIQVQNSNGQNTFEYEHKYGADNYSDDSTITPSTPSTPCLDDSLKEY